MPFLPFALNPENPFTFSVNDLLPFMAWLSDLPCQIRRSFDRGVPDLPRNKMSLCSRHDFQKSGLFAPEKLDIGLFQGVEFAIIPPKNRCFTWPDPQQSY